MDQKTSLLQRPNIGPKVAGELARVGIHTYEALAAVGSVEAALRIAAGRPHTGYNLLYALEGAVRGVRWHDIDRPELERLKAEYDRRRRGGGGC